MFFSGCISFSHDTSKCKKDLLTNRNCIRREVLAGGQNVGDNYIGTKEHNKTVRGPQRCKSVEHPQQTIMQRTIEQQQLTTRDKTIDQPQNTTRGETVDR